MKIITILLILSLATLTQAATVARYRFAGDLRDEGPHGLHLQAAGNARVVDGALHFYEVGDRVTVAIPNELLMPGRTASPLTIEARFYVRAYKTYSLSNYLIIALEQAWDAQFTVRDDQWSRWPRVMVGNSHPVIPSEWAARVSFDAWHTLTITHDSEGLTSIFIDGDLLGQSTYALHYGRTNDWTLTLGNFDGQIDQVRISNIVRAAVPLEPAPPEEETPSEPLAQSARLTGLTLTTEQPSGKVEFIWLAVGTVAIEATIVRPAGLTAAWTWSLPGWQTAERWSGDTLRVAAAGLTAIPIGQAIGHLAVTWTDPQPGKKTITLLEHWSYARSHGPIYGAVELVE